MTHEFDVVSLHHFCLRGHTSVDHAAHTASGKTTYVMHVSGQFRCLLLETQHTSHPERVGSNWYVTTAGGHQLASGPRVSTYKCKQRDGTMLVPCAVMKQKLCLTNGHHSIHAYFMELTAAGTYHNAITVDRTIDPDPDCKRTHVAF
jgi:hypothetical protein